MCGIVGIAGAINNRKMQLSFRDLLVIDQIRGFDSTGVLGVLVDPTEKCPTGYNVHKDIVPPSELWERSTSSVFSWWGEAKGDVKVMLGHNRATTVGASTAANAHPFEFGDTIGVHNGTLTYWNDLINYHKHDVDSKALIENIDEYGVEETWKTFVGAAAVVWWDNKNETLHFARNNQRTLFYAYTADRNAIIWASEWWMIIGAADRNKVALEKWGKGEKGAEGTPKLLTFEPDTHYQFEPTTTDCKLVKTKKLEPRVNFMRASGATGYGTTSHRNNSPRIGKAFPYVTGWKKSMERHGKSYQTVRLSNCRDESDVNGVRFRFTVFTKTNSWKGIGFCDVYPANNAERDRLLDLDRYAEIEPMSDLWANPDAGCANYPAYAIAACNTRLPKKKESDKERHMFVGWDNNLTDLTGIKKQIKEAGDSCAHCFTTIDETNIGEAFWYSRQALICGECNVDWYGDNYGNVARIH